MDALHRVLLVEPQDELRSVLARLLEGDGYAVTAVACTEGGHVSAFEAIAAREPFDAYVLSLDCPRDAADYRPESLVNAVRGWQLDVPAVCYSASLALMAALEPFITHPRHLLFRQNTLRFAIELRETLCTVLTRPAHPS